MSATLPLLPAENRILSVLPSGHRAVRRAMVTTHIFLLEDILILEDSLKLYIEKNQKIYGSLQ